MFGNSIRHSLGCMPWRAFRVVRATASIPDASGTKMEKTRHFPVIIEQDIDGKYIVECSVFEGCRSYGETVEKALDNIREAVAVCMEEYDKDACT